MPSVIWSVVPGIVNCPVPLVYPCEPAVALKLPLAISLMLLLFADIVITFDALTELSMPVLVVSCLRK